MNTPSATDWDRAVRAWAVPIILMGVAATYAGSLGSDFVFDDITSIGDNLSIRHLWPPGRWLSPPATAGVAGRPLVNLTFAVNYAMSGLDVWSYHATNVLVHALAGGGLFGLVRRTLLTPALRTSLGSASAPLALAVALLWTVHPVQTATITYVSQRTEALMGLFYLLTFYCFVRGAEAGSRKWLGLAVVACGFGMACKEVMVTAPVLLLLYDRTFVGGSFRAVVRKRWRFYLALAASWLVLAGLLLGSRLSERGVGFSLGISPQVYALTELRSVVRYLGLAIWPQPLVFDYGWDFVLRPSDAWPYAAAVGGMLVAIAGLWRRAPAWAFLGCWFFGVLGPSSSFVPIAHQPMAESRLYLPLAAIIAGSMVGLHQLIGRRGTVVVSAVAIGLAWNSARRNEDYRTAIDLWSDTVAKRPDNARALNNLGQALIEARRWPEAIGRFRSALLLKPDHAEAHSNLSLALLRQGLVDEALEHGAAAVAARTGFPDAHNNWGNALIAAGRLEEAVAQFRAALKLRPDYPEAHYNLGNSLLQIGRVAEAIGSFTAAVALKPDYLDAHINLANALFRQGHMVEAVAHYETALKLGPENAVAHFNLGSVRLFMGDTPAAAQHLTEALRLKPAYAEAHLGLAKVRLKDGRTAEATEHLREALRHNPNLAEAACLLGNIQFRAGNWSEAIVIYEATLRIQPDYVEAHNNLGATFLKVGRLDAAIEHLQTALRLQPDLGSARQNLEVAHRLATP